MYLFTYLLNYNGLEIWETDGWTNFVVVMVPEWRSRWLQRVNDDDDDDDYEENF